MKIYETDKNYVTDRSITRKHLKTNVELCYENNKFLAFNPIKKIHMHRKK